MDREMYTLLTEKNVKVKYKVCKVNKVRWGSFKCQIKTSRLSDYLHSLVRL